MRVMHPWAVSTPPPPQKKGIRIDDRDEGICTKKSSRRRWTWNMSGMALPTSCKEILSTPPGIILWPRTTRECNKNQKVWFMDDWLREPSANFQALKVYAEVPCSAVLTTAVSSLKHAHAKVGGPTCIHSNTNGLVLDTPEEPSDFP